MGPCFFFHGLAPPWLGSPGPLILWFLVLWSPGPGPLVLWSPGFSASVASWLLGFGGFLASRLQWLRGSWLLGFLASWLLGFGGSLASQDLNNFISRMARIQRVIFAEEP